MSDIFNNIQNQYTVNQPAAGKPAETTTSEPQQAVIKDSLPASAVNEEQADTVELSTKEKTKQGPVRTVKNFIAKIKKFFASANEYIKGTAKGIASGAVAASLIYTFGNIVNYVKSKSAEKAGTMAKKVPNKVLAAAAACIAVAVNLWNASLNATERSSNIDHRWTGHQNNG